MNKTVATILKIFIFLVLTGAILFGVYYGVSYRSEANKMAEELRVGQDFEAKGDYLSAIAS